MSLRICSDVHGKFEQYYSIVKAAEYSIQLGDFGFRDTYQKLMNSKLNPNNHKFFGGNHSDYDWLDTNECPYYLKDYGKYELGGLEFFFVRGAFSIDKAPRIWIYNMGGLKSWFEQEEMSYNNLQNCIDYYTIVKPKIMITHCPPQSIANLIGNPDMLRNFGFGDTAITRTGMALEKCMKYISPNIGILAIYTTVGLKR